MNYNYNRDFISLYIRYYNKAPRLITYTHIHIECFFIFIFYKQKLIHCINFCSCQKLITNFT